MKNCTRIALSTLAIAIGSTLAHAQQPTEDDLNPQNRNPVGTQQGSQLDNDNSNTPQRGNTTQQGNSSERDNSAQLANQQNRDSSTQSAMTLEQLAMMKPEELAGKTLTDDDGDTIGQIERIALKRDDQSAYAIVNTQRNGKAALRLGELEIGALAYTQPADTLSDQEYQSSDYERFEQSRTDPRGNAGLQNAPGASAGNASSSAASNSAGNSSSAAAGNSSTTTASNAASTLGQTAAEGASVVGQLDGSLVEQLAMMQPDELEGIKLKSDNGEELGEIDHVAKSRNDDQMVAVIDLEEGGMAVVPVDYLQVSAVQYDGDEDDLEEQSFDESEFQMIGAR